MVTIGKESFWHFHSRVFKTDLYFCLDESFDSASSSTVLTKELPNWIALGVSVKVLPGATPAIVRYVGPTEFASGYWIGVELALPRGKYICRFVNDVFLSLPECFAALL